MLVKTTFSWRVSCSVPPCSTAVPIQWRVSLTSKRSKAILQRLGCLPKTLYPLGTLRVLPLEDGSRRAREGVETLPFFITTKPRLYCSIEALGRDEDTTRHWNVVLTCLFNRVSHNLVDGIYCRGFLLLIQRRSDRPIDLFKTEQLGFVWRT